MRKSVLGTFLLVVLLQGVAWGGQRTLGAGIKITVTRPLHALQRSIEIRQRRWIKKSTLKRQLRQDSTLKRSFKVARSRHINRVKLIMNQCSTSGLIVGPLTCLAGAQIAHQPLGKLLLVVGGARFAWGFVGAKLWHSMVRDASRKAFREILPGAMEKPGRRLP